MSGAADQVYGTSYNYAWGARGEAMAMAVAAHVPENALAVLSEGFCPNCLAPLGGAGCRWCPSCRVFWNVRQER